MTEQWLPVPGYEGYYEVSDHGRVRSLPRAVQYTGRGTWRLRGRMLTLQSSRKSPYLRVPLSRGGKVVTTLVHRLVLETFVGPCPPGMECCHNDGNPCNNPVSNLRWDTRTANSLDAVRHGTNRQTQRTHCPQGHEYTPENTVLERGGRARRCRKCKNAESARRYARRKANVA